MRSNSAVDDVGVGDLVGLRLGAPPGVLSSLTYLKSVALTNTLRRP